MIPIVESAALFAPVATGLAWLGGVAWALAWPAASVTAVGCGYLGLGPGVFGKRADGTLRAAHTVLHFPYHVVAWLRVKWDAWRLREHGQMEGSVGPIDGFRLLYRVQLTQVAVPTRSGIDQVRPVVDEKYEYVPTTTLIGEPIEQAVSANSNLLRALRGSSPGTTTVTIWTYPDSFAEFRVLKKALFDLGFAAAGRPLPAGEVISASPSGTRSAAQ